MTPLHVVVFVISFHVQESPRPRLDCREWPECRQLALDAAARQDYETFHDLAWRAVQTGPRNDPALMYLLARAQSLSGRPADALVMLQRLARMGAPNDAATHEEFRRVRALPAWSEFDVVLASPADSGSGRALRAEPRVEAKAGPGVEAMRAESRAPAGPVPAESVRFTTTPFTPAGLAYDAVSRRFIVGDRRARKLSVVDEFSRHVANLASAQSTGFGEIAALEIDPRLGNLWVVSAGDPQTTLHKLQLVSGRALERYVPAARFGGARFADVATTPGSTVFVLDSAGHRLFRLPANTQELELAATLPDLHATSVAPAANAVVYVAHERGILLVDLASRAATPLTSAAGVELAGVARVRWHKGSLIAVQHTGVGTYRAIRVALDRTGRKATGLEVLDRELATTDPTAAAIAGGVLYYLASGDGSELIVRKVTLH